MNSCQKYFSVCVLALLSQAAFAQAPNLGAASGFAVLGGTAVTCTAPTSVVFGDVGVAPGAVFTNTACAIAGTPHVNDAAAIAARAAVVSAYAELQSRTCTTQNTISGNLAGRSLAPGVYCVAAASATTGGTLTLNGPSTGIWIFKIGTSGTGALTGTNFSVVMAGGGKACNVYWRVAEAATMTDSNFKGTILAGAAITITGGIFAGRALANESAAVTMTGASLIGCDASGALLDAPAALVTSLSCKGRKGKKNGNDNDDDDDDDDDGDHKKKKKSSPKSPFHK